MGRDASAIRDAARSCWFQFTRPAWGATDGCRYFVVETGVSIHAPRVGRDAVYRSTRKMSWVSIHAPRVGRDEIPTKTVIALAVFQFTRPAWGATRSRWKPESWSRFQFTRPAWGATVMTTPGTVAFDVSIHAPRVGRDGLDVRLDRCDVVSIHAPRVGRDFSSPSRRRQARCVSIHAPRVGRDHLSAPLIR